MRKRTASFKEAGDEVSQAEWDRFDAAVAQTGPAVAERVEGTGSKRGRRAPKAAAPTGSELPAIGRR